MNLLVYGLLQLKISEKISRNAEYLRKTNYNVGILKETVLIGETSMREKQYIVY